MTGPIPSDRLPLLQQPLAVLRAIYSRCRADSRIALGSRRDGAEGPRYLTNVAVGDLDSMLPPILEHAVEETQYVMLNTLHARHAVKRPFAGEPQYFRARNDSVEELNALYLDLDVGRAEGPASIPAPMALGMVLIAVQQGRVPLPSLAALSGRGAYAVWLLRGDEEGDPPPRATYEAVARWRAVELELHRRLDHVFSDGSATAVARWLKRPGTVDTLKVQGRETKSGREVIYMTFGYDLARVPVYSLPQLSDLLGVQVAPPPPLAALPAPEPRERKSRRRTVKVGKGSEPYAARVREIELLNTHRHGMKPGTRRLALFHYARAVEAWHRITHPEDARAAFARAAEQAERLNRTFDPPHSERELYDSLPRRRVGSQKIRTRNATVARDLKVTRAEVEALSLRSIVPTEIAAERAAAELELRVDRDLKVNGVRVEIDSMIRAGLGDSEIAARVGTSRQRVRARRVRMAALGQLAEEVAADLFGPTAAADRGTRS